VEAAIRNKTPFVVDYRLKHKDGSFRDMMEQGKIIFDDAGEATMIDGVIFDVSEQKKAEAESKEKMAELKMINDVAVSRELKMIELEKEVDGLLKKLGEAPKYGG
jgi:PAS domain-containing protein